MKSILFILFLFPTTISIAQFPHWSWAKSAGNGRNDYGNAITITNDNMIYCVGQFNSPAISFGTTVLTNAGGDNETNDIFIVKYNESGEMLWAKSIGGSDDDFGKSIAADKAGNLYITGGYASRKIVFGKDTLTNAGQAGTNDAYLAKYNSSGELVWVKSIGGTHDDKADCITVDKDANVYIIGSFGSGKLIFQKGDTLKNKNDPSGSSTDIFIAKYNAAGKLIWTRGINGNGNTNDYGYGITTDRNNNVIVTGGSYSNQLSFDSVTISNSVLINENKHELDSIKAAYMKLDAHGKLLDTTGGNGIKNESEKYVKVMLPPPHSRIFEKIFIAKYSESGKLQWAESVGGSDDEEGSAITTDNNDNIFITGRFQSTSFTVDSTTMDNKGSNDIFIAKYSTDGKNLWAKSVGGIADDRGNSITTDKAGNAYITGWFGSPKVVFGKSILINSSGKGYTDMFIAKYDGVGNALWSENAKGTDNDWSNGVAIDKLGNIYLTGGFDSPEINFADTKLLNGKAKSFFIAKISN